ncbi:hypothetical protein CONLIGDRAFT_680463 [Coniochaeta ligniaria NRRL 30616]|uniref:Uncharacterized protein n=1 Tax=Coniochaeta ligniaria NRRL 30616 TaxID=1408157 RepID=A0A1J7JK29_9PEZI|nr:hypothetical protein CONLIGDRAFT_680463 [Coniochaeta ligniaria NRRL 30616]
MDFDIEMDDVPVDALPVPEEYTSDIVVGEEQEPGEIDEEPTDTNGDAQSEDRAIVPYKVHIRGLDTFTAEDVKAYVAEHFGSSYEKIEWIDDTSLNLVFGSESVAQGALTALAGVEISDVTQLPPLQSIAAKPFSKKPDSSLHVRFAVGGDRKIAGAAARSRFYLLHPEYDPEERKRRGEIRGKYRDREGYGRRNDRERGSGRRKEERIDDYDVNTFDVSLYDDDAPALAKRATTDPRARRESSGRLRRESPQSDEGNRDYAQKNREKELFPNLKSRDRNGGSRRDRSASPIRDDTLDDDLARDRAAVRNREQARAVKDRLAKDNAAKELFPTKVSTSVSGGTARMDQVDTRTVLTSAKLADRITPRPAETESAFNIRGLAAKRTADQGFAIKGTGTNVKELFPEKFGSAGKELFPEKLDGRGRRRQKAEDTFR